MKLNAEKLEVQKSKVKLTISLYVNDFNTTKEKHYQSIKFSY